MRFAALGRTTILLDSIKAAVERGHECVVVGTCPAAPEYRVTESDFRRLADDLGCTFFCDPRINSPEYATLLREREPRIGISVNWQTVIGEEILDVFPLGIVNAHTGDLPRYRGNAASGWAILQGESDVVLTLHRMVSQLDAGPVLAQRRYPIDDSTYIEDVCGFAEGEYPRMFAEMLDGFAEGTLGARPQAEDPRAALRCYPRLPRDGEIDWCDSAEQIVRLVRASGAPFRGAFTYCDGRLMTVWRARHEIPSAPYLAEPGQVTERRPETGEVAVATPEGWVVLESVEPEREGVQRPAEVIRSIRTRLGMDVGGEVTNLKRRVAELEARLQEYLDRDGDSS